MLIRKSITVSVAVRKPLIKHAQRLTKEAPIGAKIAVLTAYAIILKSEASKLRNKLGNGADLMKNPYGTKPLSNWKTMVLKR